MDSLQDSPISASAKCAQLLVSIRHKQAGDQDTESSQKLLHFGSVAVGCSAERQIKLCNPSAVCSALGLAALQIHPLYRVPPSLHISDPKPGITLVCSHAHSSTACVSFSS